MYYSFEIVKRVWKALLMTTFLLLFFTSLDFHMNAALKKESAEINGTQFSLT